MSRITTILLAGALLAALGCTSKAKTEAPAFVNANCPIMGNEVEADGGSTTWDGKEVGFCCGKCVGKFEAMDDAQKQAALDKYNK
jgi:hypothetical protein